MCWYNEEVTCATVKNELPRVRLLFRLLFFDRHEFYNVSVWYRKRKKKKESRKKNARKQFREQANLISKDNALFNRNDA